MAVRGLPKNFDKGNAEILVCKEDAVFQEWSKDVHDPVTKKVKVTMSHRQPTPLEL